MSPCWTQKQTPAHAPRRGRSWVNCIGIGAAFGLTVTALHSQTTANAPSQAPLLATVMGAKPNVMITLDNSGSMSKSFQDTYGVFSDSNSPIQFRKCPTGTWSDLSGDWLPASIADYRNNHRCIYKSGSKYYYSQSISEPFAYDATSTGHWYAQRSAQVNPLYYNPRITYKPRLTHTGKPATETDGIVFISNQDSTNFSYKVFTNSFNPEEIRSTHSIYANNPAIDTGWNVMYNWTLNYRIPQHAAHTQNSAYSAPAFTYVSCKDVITVGGLQTGCRRWDPPVNIRYGSFARVPLPADHERTDCGPTSCSNAQEIANILNWYRYYLFRAPAVATSIGQALAAPEYEGKLRLGYTLINGRNGSDIFRNNHVPGSTNNRPMLLRGVRPHRLHTPDALQFYAWLYDQDGTQNANSNQGSDPRFNSSANRVGAPYGGTPLHNAIDRVASYYKVASGVTQNPWSTDPATIASTSNPEMSCRRSFNLLLSDGAWNGGSSTNAGADHDSTVGPVFFPGSASSGNDGFQYLPQGINTFVGRQLYTPYGGPATSGLADLTARYHWHEDFRPSLPNDVPTRPGQPAFWQNMTTYTIGYLIAPSGQSNAEATKLTFEQIDNYRAQYPQLGYGASTRPRWATGDVNVSEADAERIDDFIQAGFTGGGSGFSVRSANDIRQVFRTILSDILNATGRDAGVAVSSSGTNNSTIAGNLKYSVTYKSLDNSGDVTAHEIDEQGNIVGTRWQASQTIPEPQRRRVYAMSSHRSPVDFAGSFRSLPADIRASLQSGPDAPRIPGDERFVNYLRGLDPVLDANGRLFRRRSSKMGALINPPAIYMGADSDFAYDLAEGQRVTGSEHYQAYIRSKVALPATLLVATNAGQVHSFDAATGSEFAAFMPRRSLKRMLDYANESYEFKYVLDGPLSEHDIYDGKQWNHLAVGTGGRGEPLVYALRSPLRQAGANPPNRIPERTDFLWETGPDVIDGKDVTMGHISNPARSGQTRSGHWVVIVNSGHYNGRADGSGHGLFVLDAMTGKLIRRIPLPSAYPAGRGLGGVTLVRDEGKRIVAAYAGDARGQLWRFDLKGQPSQWSVSYGKPLFTAEGNRPIYGAPAWQPSAQHGTGTVVMFATGMLLDETDKGDVSQPESIYGIWDPTPVGENDAPGFTTRDLGDLLEQGVESSTATAGGESAAANTFYKSTAKAYNPHKHRGWRLSLTRATGERSLDQIRNLGKNVLVSSTVIEPPPKTEEETCRLSSLPTNYLYVLDAQTGSMPLRALDQNGDGKLDAYSVVQMPAGGYTRNLIVRVLDSREQWNVQRREQTNAQADEGEGRQQERCLPILVRLLGTESGSVTAGSVCSSTGWSRTHYQLMRPPL